MTANISQVRLEKVQAEFEGKEYEYISGTAQLNAGDERDGELEMKFQVKDGFLYWTSDWTVIIEIVDTLGLNEVSYGPGTYGHVDDFLSDEILTRVQNGEVVELA